MRLIGKVQAEITSLSARHEDPQPAASAASLSSTTLVVPPDTAHVAAPVSSGRRGWHHLLLAGGFAPFLPTGTAGYYFSVGYLPSILASYTLEMPGGELGLGLYAGLDYFNAQGVQDSAASYMVPVGLDLRYELGGRVLHPFFHVAGGPAFLIMITGTQGTLVDVLPFLRSGIGLEVQVTSWMGISALADYDVYFEMPYLLTGFSPSLNMVFRP